MNLLNFSHLRYFWTVARLGSLPAAARDLHLTPQTMSSQIRALEEHLGEKLFDRTGRRLVLTEAGTLASEIAGEIFALGQELTDVMAGRSTNRMPRVTVGIADVLPKSVAQQLVAPALRLEKAVRVVCREARAELLLAEMAIHGVDVVLTDAPLPASVSVRAYNHLLGECGVTVMGSAELAEAVTDDFPASLDGSPFLLPTEGTTLRRSLDQWFKAQGVRPTVAGEFEDSALLVAFGETGLGLFAVPSLVVEQVARHYDVVCIGPAEGAVERFYAISPERRVKHPAVAAICEAARKEFCARDG